jgi:hypothetical protein
MLLESVHVAMRLFAERALTLVVGMLSPHLLLN